MFTPQKKAPWTPIPSSPVRRTDDKRISSAAKGKAVAFIDDSSAAMTAPPPPPPLSFLEGNGGGTGYDSGSMEDWVRFKEVGLLDADALDRRDNEAMAETVSRLEQELHDYQYNMGLLLIEKKDLSADCEDLQREVAEAREIFKREQSAHFIAMSEAEKREENLKRALDLEKHCVIDLKRAVHEIRDELEQAKATTKIDNENARIAQLHDDRAEVEGKLHLANIRVSEADRMINELDMKLQELQAHESTLVGQHQTLDTERETYESRLKKQKEEFKVWERALQEREERLHEQRRTIEEREDRLCESERRFKPRENDIDQLQKKTDADIYTLKQREDDVSKRLNELGSKEKEAESLRINLVRTEKQLRALEERLSDKERVEIQKVVDEHRAFLETKSAEFELEMQQKRNSLDEEFKAKLHAIEKKEAEVNHKEAKHAKMEQAIREKSERVKEKEKKIEERSKALKQEESSLKKREKSLNSDKKHLSADRENMQLLNSEIEKLRDELRKKEQLIEEENEKLNHVEETRSKHIRLQLSLNREMEKWKHQNEILMKEKEDLSDERRKFEKDWEALDEKRATVESELKKFDEEKERLERFRYLEEEKLNEKKAEMDGHIEQELESIRLEKESFADKMKHEHLILAETAQNERAQIIQEFEERRRELENRLQKQEEEMEKEFQEKKLSFEEMRSIEMRNISNLKEIAENQKEEMEAGWLKVKKIKDAVAFDKQKLEENQLEIHKDIRSLGILSKKLKQQREQLLEERTRFLNFVERLKVCQTCGDFTSKFAVSVLHLPPVTGTIKSSPEAADGTDMSESAGQKSWIKKCASKIFKISSITRMQDESDRFPEGSPSFALQPSVDKTDEDESELGQNPSASTSNAFEAQNMQLNISINKAATEDPSFVDAPSNIDSKEETGREESEQSNLRIGRRRTGRKVSPSGRKRAAKTTSRQEGADEDEEPSYSNQVEKTTPRKRTRANSSRRKEIDSDDYDSYGPADSVAGGGRKKRKETEASALVPPGEKRYNLRRNKIAGTSTADEASTLKANEDTGAPNHSKSSKKAAQNPERDSAVELHANSENIRSENQGPGSTPKSIDMSSERAVRFKMPVGDADDNVEVTKPVENHENIISQEPNSIEDTLLTEEAPDAPENEEDDDNENVLFDDEDEDEDDGADDEAGDVSVGRKLWKFFTT